MEGCAQIRLLVFMNMQIQPQSKSKLTGLLALLALTPVLAQAHPGHGNVHSFAGGFSHPLTGFDHILAMVAVGLWAAQLGGRAMYLVPAAFVGVMTLGGALGMAGVHLPMVEAGIMVSILVLGLLIAAAVRLPAAAGMAIVGLFALFHGHAHGAELPAGATGLTYALGFIAATICLHAVGIGLGLLAQKKLPAPAIRWAGAAIIAGGVCLWVV
jgi:urease accessory protein